MILPHSTRAHIEAAIEAGTAPNRALIAAETGLPIEYALSVICRVVSERHGIPAGPPWAEAEREPYERKPPKPRAGLLPCTCGHERHLSRCAVYKREKARRHLAKAG